MTLTRKPGPYWDGLDEAAKEVESWPEWKRNWPITRYDKRTPDFRLDALEQLVKGPWQLVGPPEYNWPWYSRNPDCDVAIHWQENGGWSAQCCGEDHTAIHTDPADALRELILKPRPVAWLSASDAFPTVDLPQEGWPFWWWRQHPGKGDSEWSWHRVVWLDGKPHLWDGSPACTRDWPCQPGEYKRAAGPPGYKP